MADLFTQEVEETGFVVTGEMVPTIFQPFWFARNNLIRDEEADKATVTVIHKQGASFSTDWFTFVATTDRIVLTTEDPSKFLPLRDLLSGILNLLEHTPIRALGFNTDAHYSAPTEEAWHRLGDYYAPKVGWERVLVKPGMLDVLVKGTREGSKSAGVHIRIEPSVKFSPGVYFSINEHFDLVDLAARRQRLVVTELLYLIEEEWDGFVKYKSRALDQLIQNASPKS